MKIKNIIEDVKAFHWLMNAPVSYMSRTLEEDRVNLRAGWIFEEIAELLEAKTAADQADALIDIIYFAAGTLAEMGVSGKTADACWNAVHNANMNKVFPDGKAHFKDNKVLKPANWIPPEKQIQAALMSAVMEEEREEETGRWLYVKKLPNFEPFVLGFSSKALELFKRKGAEVTEVHLMPVK